MKRFFLFFLLSVFALTGVSAQFAIQSTYHTALQDDQTTLSATSLVDGSIHYWTRLKRYRLQFQPGLLFQAFNTSEQENYQNIGVTVPISVYPLDFVNDCDCPTFSKTAVWFKKGFFIRFTPSWSASLNQGSPEALKQLVSGGLSLGLDIGLSDLVTITPLIGIDRIHSLSGQSGYGNYLHGGISVLLRHDYSRKYR